MSAEKKVISLAKARALRDTLEALHSPEAQTVIYGGALAEFKRLISPALRELLSAKGAPVAFQNELVAMLERVYATHHVDEKELPSLLRKIGPR